MSGTPTTSVDLDQTAEHGRPGEAKPGAMRPALEIGIVIAPGAPESLVERAVQTVEEALVERFPAFAWSFPRLHMGEHQEARQEMSALLAAAAEERDNAHWDLVLLITPAGLAGYRRPRALGGLSRPLDAAVLSLASLGDRSDRLATLMLHAIAHICGLDASRDASNLLFHPPTPEAIDVMGTLTRAQHESWNSHLVEIADQRLEEARGRPEALRFVLRAAWINRVEILEAIAAARPWELPYRLGRLTTAATSTVAIVLMTAESWDLALTLRASQLTLFALVALLTTSFFVAERQNLVPRRRDAETEQGVVSALSALAIVALGMTTAWLMLAALALAGAATLFGPELIASWASTTVQGEEQVTATVQLQMATFVASIAVIIGSLGASFENQHYFRHVILVDEEL